MQVKSGAIYSVSVSYYCKFRKAGFRRIVHIMPSTGWGIGELLQGAIDSIADSDRFLTGFTAKLLDKQQSIN